MLACGLADTERPAGFLRVSLLVVSHVATIRALYVYVMERMRHRGGFGGERRIVVAKQMEEEEHDEKKRRKESSQRVMKRVAIPKLSWSKTKRLTLPSF